jgi:hypothetical protein
VPRNGKIDFEFGGIKVYHFCSGSIGEIEGLFRTIEAFVGTDMLHPFIPYFDTKTPEYMEQTNISFLEAAMGFKVEKRPTYEVKIPAEMIHSGDFFVISRLDGLDPMIQYGTGSRGGHCTRCLVLAK